MLVRPKATATNDPVSGTVSRMKLSRADRDAFLEIVWSWYDANGRHELAWRQSESDRSFDPYKILVSEVMLQQTQVTRVIPKFAAFIEEFPDYAHTCGE